MAKTKIDRITEKFSQLVIKLEVMARDTESVRSVCMETLADARHNDLRSRDGYLYAARSMSTKNFYGYKWSTLNKNRKTDRGR